LHVKKEAKTVKKAEAELAAEVAGMENTLQKGSQPYSFFKGKNNQLSLTEKSHSPTVLHPSAFLQTMH